MLPDFFQGSFCAALCAINNLHLFLRLFCCFLFPLELELDDGDLLLSRVFVAYGTELPFMVH